MIHVTPGKDQTTIERIKTHLGSKGVDPKQVTDACIDMSPSFIAGMLEHFPDTSITFDKFHVVKLLNEAMNEVRKAEAREHAILKGHKYTLLKRDNKLSVRQKQEREQLIELLPAIGKAYRLKTLFVRSKGFLRKGLLPKGMPLGRNPSDGILRTRKKEQPF